MTLIDTNVILDVVAEDSHWFSWSKSRLQEAAARGPLLLNDVIYAEVSVRFTDVEAVDAFLADVPIILSSIPKAALFMAGKAFQQYRQAGGLRTAVLPDFIIGAHAAASGLTLLSRDRGRYRSYFPAIDLIAP